MASEMMSKKCDPKNHKRCSSRQRSPGQGPSSQMRTPRLGPIALSGRVPGGGVRCGGTLHTCEDTELLGARRLDRRARPPGHTRRGDIRRVLGSSPSASRKYIVPMGKWRHREGIDLDQGHIAVQIPDNESILFRLSKAGFPRLSPAELVRGASFVSDRRLSAGGLHSLHQLTGLNWLTQLKSPEHGPGLACCCQTSFTLL